MRHFIILILSIAVFSVKAQTTEFIFPEEPDWNVAYEGDTLSFTLKLADSLGERYNFSLEGDRDLQIHFDSLGHFIWVPSYELIDRVQESNEYGFIFEAISTTGNKIRKEVSFTIFHKNRPPSIGELPAFYVKQYTRNEFNLKQLDQIKDPDGDPIVFTPILSEMPEGANLSEIGVFTWKPSRTQFYNLRKEPLEVHFTVQDQPEKLEQTGKLVIAPTQLDLPPEILMVPNDTLFRLQEDEVLNLNFYVSDPNGDDNLRNVAFVSNDLRIPKSALKENTATQWEFTWTPGYDFVGEEEGTQIVEIVIYALDEANKRAERIFHIEIIDTEDVEKKDQRLYSRYRSMLATTMDLIAHLDYNQKVLNKQLKKAKRGKKNRSILNASLGAITGVSPVFLENEGRDYVTGIGGTAVLTLGTLEATEVMGRSKDDILERLKINIDIRNQLQSEGDQFARKYALKSQRRDKDFNTDLDKLKAQLNNKKMILLELDAGWENPNKPTDKNIKKQFPDFNNEGYEGLMVRN